MTTDPIQAAIDALNAIQNGVLWGRISTQVRDEFSQEIETIREGLRLRAHQSAQGWQPIETAPKDGTPVLAAFKGQFGWIIFIAQYADMFGTLWAQGYAPPTHWMPLPQPPATIKAAGGE